MSVIDPAALADWRSVWHPVDPATPCAEGAYPA
jgi:hypothetical protein